MSDSMFTTDDQVTQQSYIHWRVRAQWPESETSDDAVTEVEVPQLATPADNEGHLARLLGLLVYNAASDIGIDPMRMMDMTAAVVLRVAALAATLEGNGDAK